MSKRVLLVGHCNVDGPWLAKEVSNRIDNAEAVRVNSRADLEQECEQGSRILLVNREPVGFNESGIELIEQVRERYPDCTCLLVSDRPDAQEKAEAAGALPGFGKAEVETDRFVEAVKGAMA